MRETASVLAVFALLGGMLWLLRSPLQAGKMIAKLPRLGRLPGLTGSPLLQRAQRGRVLQSIERLSLTPQHALHVIRFEDHEIVIATHPQGCTLLLDKTSSGQAASTAEHAAGGAPQRAEGAAL